MNTYLSYFGLYVRISQDFTVVLNTETKTRTSRICTPGEAKFFADMGFSPSSEQMWDIAEDSVSWKNPEPVEEGYHFNLLIQAVS